MRARFAKVVGHRVMAVLKNGERVEICRVDGALVEPSWNWDEIKAKYGNLSGVSSAPIWDTPSGELEPGCLYYADWLPNDMWWDNQVGPHLCAVLPNGNHWNIESRASNCTMKDDRTHRCWCRHGEVPNITVDKNGHTCQAGAGSIASGNYHGFLRNGEFV